MSTKATPAENAAYGTGCTIAARLTRQYPGIGDDLRTLLDAARTEQRLACERGRPIYSAAENAAALQETRARLSASLAGSAWVGSVGE